MGSYFLRATLTVALATFGLLNAAMPAQAALSGTPIPTPVGASVETIAPPSLPVCSTASASYTVRQTNLPSGTVVHEYAGQDGNVFAIAWSGPRMPDVAALFGSYLPQVTNAVEAQRAQRDGGRGPARIDQSGLVVRSGGHMGFFAGQAYLPQMLPAGVTGSDIR
ncbi:DUF2844 domain-containing protein [Paraburkholderia sp. BL9I2N2]|uniref:DUF2844 domain-containing protein n=1 Tax=Paraburkholderia sp. BL9I2N2 TaxID=1938809 RepID=UPI0010473A9C|nr:DUF2844 domain-containing protein [Paraburkholderia sp. BL9I2N2]TCK84036.1 uncharacterized protein DUF2844 [Paraburkholderia sp. BL9I2N2]